MPLQAQGRAIELVGLRRCRDRVTPADIGFAVRRHRRAVIADHRPVIDPLHRFQVDDASVGAFVLEVHEPRLTRERIYPGSLVRAVGAGVAFGEHDAPLVGSVDVSGSQYELPALRYAACRGEDVVEAIALVELRAFDGWILRVAVIDERPVIQKLLAVRAHPAEDQRALQG